MDTILAEISDIIRCVAEDEANQLAELPTKNPFSYMPELAFVYQVAKELASKYQNLFPDMKCELEKEYPELGRDRVDLYLELDSNCKIAIEFKINYDVNDYIKDINKLVQITDNNLQKMFCLILTKPYIEKRYKRTIEKFQREETRIGKIAIFPTEIEAKDIKGELNVLCATWIVKN